MGNSSAADTAIGCLGLIGIAVVAWVAAAVAWSWLLSGCGDGSAEPSASTAFDETSKGEQSAWLRDYRDQLEAAGVGSAVLSDLSVDGRVLTVTVSNGWHGAPYQSRLQAAQNLWKLWAQVCSPESVDSARIRIVDLNGNKVGGSRVWGGSLIWVQEQ